MNYEDYIEAVKARLEDRLETVPEHDLDEKYIASAIRDYCESLRALEQAKMTSRREY